MILLALCSKKRHDYMSSAMGVTFDIASSHHNLDDHLIRLWDWDRDIMDLSCDLRKWVNNDFFHFGPENYRFAEST